MTISYLKNHFSVRLSARQTACPEGSERDVLEVEACSERKISPWTPLRMTFFYLEDSSDEF
jgi:hypothetical protein